MRALFFSFLCICTAAFLNLNCSHQVTDTTGKTGKTDNKITSNREKKILTNYTAQSKEKYADLLVPLKRYTTNGNVYHKKYYKYLIAIAGDIVENKKMKIVPQTVGFYYDRKSKNKNELYLGLDIDTNATYGQEYNEVAKYILQTYVKSIMETVHSCETIFKEKEVVGMVVGFYWKSTVVDVSCTLWIPEMIINLFENNKITIEELIHRSTVTNSSGKVILLKL